MISSFLKSGCTFIRVIIYLSFFLTCAIDPGVLFKSLGVIRVALNDSDERLERRDMSIWRTFSRFLELYSEAYVYCLTSNKLMS